MKSNGVSTPLDPVTGDLQSGDIEDRARTDVRLQPGGPHPGVGMVDHCGELPTEDQVGNPTLVIRDPELIVRSTQNLPAV
jgi:hypothetical protein